MPGSIRTACDKLPFCDFLCGVPSTRCKKQLSLSLSLPFSLSLHSSHEQGESCLFMSTHSDQRVNTRTVPKWNELDKAPCPDKTWHSEFCIVTLHLKTNSGTKRKGTTSIQFHKNVFAEPRLVSPETLIGWKVCRWKHSRETQHVYTEIKCIILLYITDYIARERERARRKSKRQAIELAHTVVWFKYYSFISRNT